MPVIDEKQLRFTFPDKHWSWVHKWDTHVVRQAFQLDQTRDADFVGLLKGNALWLIEAKDYRGQPQADPGWLSGKMFEKVRDTLASIVWAAGREYPDRKHLAEAAKTALDRTHSRELVVMLWIEDDVPLNPASRAAFKDKIKGALKDLVKAEVRVENRETWDEPFLQVVSLPNP